MAKFLLFFLFVVIPFNTLAQVGFQSDAPEAVLLDAATGETLYEKNAELKTGPSSMTKVMTMYVLFDALKKGEYKLDDMFYVSPNAWKKEGSRMFIEQGSNVRLEDLIRGVIVQSGNDATTCIAEGMRGTEEAFASEMNNYAQKLGMKNSNFRNSNGLPDPEHYSTVKDLAILARALIKDFPEFYHYYSEKEFTYNKIRQFNRNKLLYSTNLGADGLKTGHTAAAGYGIIGSASQKGRRVIAVVNGLKTQRDRIKEAEKLLWYGFNEFQNIRIYEKFDVITNAKVWLGNVTEVPLITDKPIDVVIKRSEKYRTKFKLEAQYKEPWTAPIKKGTHLANLVIYKNDIPVIQEKLYAANDVEEANIFEKIKQKIEYLVSGE